MFMSYLMFNVFTDFRKITILLLGLAVTACASTSITERWMGPEINAPYRHVLIIGISDSQQTRRIYENHFASELIKRNIKATPGYKLIDSKQTISRETVGRAIKGSDIDSVLVTYLVSADSELRVQESPLNSSYSGTPDDNMISATLISNRGRTSSSEVIGLKNDFYDVKSESLIWSAQTKTVAPESIDQAIIDVTALLIKQLFDDNILN